MSEINAFETKVPLLYDYTFYGVYMRYIIVSPLRNYMRCISCQAFVEKKRNEISYRVML